MRMAGVQVLYERGSHLVARWSDNAGGVSHPSCWIVIASGLSSWVRSACAAVRPSRQEPLEIYRDLSSILEHQQKAGCDGLLPNFGPPKQWSKEARRALLVAFRACREVMACGSSSRALWPRVTMNMRLP